MDANRKQRELREPRKQRKQRKQKEGEIMGPMRFERMTFAS